MIEYTQCSIVGEKAIDFTSQAIMPDNDEINEEFNLLSYIKGKNCVILFYPLNFTFVCPSELLELNKQVKEFEKRNTKVLSISIDSHFSHLFYKKELKRDFNQDIQYPMISDIEKTICLSYGVLSKCKKALRGSVIIDEDFTIRSILVNDFPIGRNIQESIRTIDAILHTKKYGQVCPANWSEGKTSMDPTIEGVKKYLSNNI